MFNVFQKSPIIAVSMRPLPQLEFEVTIARQYKPIKVYRANFLSANRLVTAVNNCRYAGKCEVSPNVVGWTAYLEIPVKPVYPPPVCPICDGDGYIDGGDYDDFNLRRRPNGCSPPCPCGCDSPTVSDPPSYQCVYEEVM